MGALPRKGILALVAVSYAAFFGCTIFNPLDHLQAGLGTSEGEGGAAGDGNEASPPDGPNGRDANGGGPDGTEPVLPGCGPEQWSGCGVTVVATPAKPGGVTFIDKTLYFTDEGGGSISSAPCTAAACSNPTVVFTGEDAPRRLGSTANIIVWTTRTQVRRSQVLPSPGTIDTLDAVSGDVGITVQNPFIIWTDDTGARGCSLTYGCGRTVLSTSAARSPAVNGATYFVADGAVQQCTWNGSSASSPTPLPGTSGAELVVRAPVLGNIFEGRFGLVASLARDGGSTFVVADHVDDAGAPIMLNENGPTPRDLIVPDNYLYWTTTTGELRRQNKDSAVVTTVLRGLSDDTVLATTSDGVLLAIADRGAGKILSYAVP